MTGFSFFSRFFSPLLKISGFNAKFFLSIDLLLLDKRLDAVFFSSSSPDNKGFANILLKEDDNFYDYDSTFISLADFEVNYVCCCYCCSCPPLATGCCDLEKVDDYFLEN